MHMAHPKGKAQPNDINAKRRLTGTLSLTAFRPVPRAMANRSGAPPGAESNAPAKAGTNARANHSIAPDWSGETTRNRGTSQ